MVRSGKRVSAGLKCLALGLGLFIIWISVAQYRQSRITSSIDPTQKAAKPSDWALPQELSQKIRHATNLEVCYLVLLFMIHA